MYCKCNDPYLLECKQQPYMKGGGWVGGGQDLLVIFYMVGLVENMKFT